MMLERFGDAPEEALIDLSRYHLTGEQAAAIRAISRAQTHMGARATPDSIRALLAHFDIPPDPVLRALGWGPRDRDMLAGRITTVIEGCPETAGTALCAIAKRHARNLL